MNDTIRIASKCRKPQHVQYQGVTHGRQIIRPHLKDIRKIKINAQKNIWKLIFAISFTNKCYATFD